MFSNLTKIYHTFFLFHSSKKKRGSKKDAKTEEERQRLSTMTEVDDEEDCGITIRIDAPTPIPSNLNSPQDDSQANGSSVETPV